MRSVIESEKPLIVAIQHSKSGLFSKFHFTCFEWIIHDKLFRSQSFNLKNLCAAGTEEGPILLISKLAQSVVPICLLCVHKRKVTNIIMSHQINTFLSVSADGSIAGWHCSDGSCCFAYDNLVAPGKIQITLCDSDASLAWFWTLGECASLVDLKRGNVLQKIDFQGISSFSILKRHSFFLSESQDATQNQKALPSYAIMVGINTMRTYQIDEKTNFLSCTKIENISFILGQKRCITPNGIVIYKKNSLQIFLPNLDVPIYTDNIHDMSDDDMILNISWRNLESLIIGTFKGFFKIYKIQIQKNESTQRIGIVKVSNFSCQNCYIFSNIALNSDIGVVIFAATQISKKSRSSKNNSTVMCLSMQDQKVDKLTIPQMEKICCIPDPNSRIVIQSEKRSSTFQIFDWGLSASISQTSNISSQSNSNIPIDSDDYKSPISKSFVSTQQKQGLKAKPSSEIRNYSLFGRQLPLSQSVDFRPNMHSIQSSFVMREGSSGNVNRTAYITAIASQNFNNLSLRLQIIVGASDGKLYFFWENNLLPFEVSEALISPIVAIVLLPIRFTKASCLVAIGQNGSFCLFKWNKLSHRYVTNNLPIVSIGLVEMQRLIVVQKSDDSFTIYNLNSPEPIAVMLRPPFRTVTIWSTVNFSRSAGIQSTLSLQIGGSSLFYSVLEVSKLGKLRRQKTAPIPTPEKRSSLFLNQTPLPPHISAMKSRSNSTKQMNQQESVLTNNKSVHAELKGENMNTKSSSYHNLNPTSMNNKNNIKNEMSSDANSYSEFKALVNTFVESNSSCDSIPNSDSNNDLCQIEASSNNNINEEVNVINSSENNKDTDNSDFLLLNEVSISSNFNNSFANINPKKASFNEIQSNKSNESLREDANYDPISQTGKFTAHDIKHIARIILEMITPSLNNSKSRSFSIGTNHSNLEKNKWHNLEQDQDGLSFVLVGHRNLPTFFYPIYKLSGPTVFDTSPFNAALHYLSYKIMSNFLNLKSNTEKFEKENKFKICGFISILTQFLFINDPEIQKISALTCDRIVNWSSSGIVVPENVWNLLVASYIQYFNKDDVADYDKFLMAIMMVTHADLVDPIYHKLVFDFLVKQSREKCPSNFLAFNILLSNFSFWAELIQNRNRNKSNDLENLKDKDNESNYSGNSESDENKRVKKELMIHLLITFIKYENEEKELVKEKLYCTINENFNAFCESIRFILSNRQSPNIASITCSICSDLADEFPGVGAVGPLFIAHLADSYNMLQDVFYSNLKIMQKKFPNEIAYEDQIWLFATNDGYIHVYKNTKLFFNEKVANGPIYMVSLAPGAAIAAIITKNDPTLIKIDLRSSLFMSFSKKRVIDSVKIDIREGFGLDNMKIEWDSKKSCHVQYYLK